MKINKKITLSILMGTAVIAGCQSGQNLNYNTVSTIQKNVTTEQQIRAVFGEPTETYTNMNRGTKTLVYEYTDSDKMKKLLAGVAGATAGGLLGSLVGGGSGKDIAIVGGAVAGGGLAGNAVNSRTVKKQLTVIISLATGRVINYNFTEDGSRSQSWRPSTGPESL